MAMGMPYDLYWYGDVRVTNQYYRAYKIRQKQKNEEAWLFGVYVYKAVETVAYNIMRGRNDKPREYPSEPIDSKRTAKADMTVDQQRVFARAYMMQMMEAGKGWGK